MVSEERAIQKTLVTCAIGHLLPRSDAAWCLAPVLVSQIWPATEDATIPVDLMIYATLSYLTVALDELLHTDIVHIGALLCQKRFEMVRQW